MNSTQKLFCAVQAVMFGALFLIALISCKKEIDPVVADSAPETDPYYTYELRLYGEESIKFDLDLDSNGTVDGYYSLERESSSQATYSREKIVITNPDWNTYGFVRTDTFCLDTTYTDSANYYVLYDPCSVDTGTAYYYNSHMIHMVDSADLENPTGLSDVFLTDTVLIELFDRYGDETNTDPEITREGLLDGDFVVFENSSLNIQKALFISRQEAKVLIGKAYVDL